MYVNEGHITNLNLPLMLNCYNLQGWNEKCITYNLSSSLPSVLLILLQPSAIFHATTQMIAMPKRATHLGHSGTHLKLTLWDQSSIVASHMMSTTRIWQRSGLSSTQEASGQVRKRVKTACDMFFNRCICQISCTLPVTEWSGERKCLYLCCSLHMRCDFYMRATFP